MTLEARALPSRPVLRTGTAVHEVDAGLLLCGWQRSSLVRGPASLIALWRHLDHSLARADELTALAGLPPAARPAARLLLDELRRLDMIGPADMTRSDRDAFADPATVARRGSCIELTGDPGAGDAVRDLLRGLGLPSRPDSTVTSPGMAAGSARLTVWITRNELDLQGAPDAHIVAARRGDAVVVAPMSDPASRTAVHSIISAMRGDGGAPPKIAWTIAETDLVDRVVSSLHGSSDRSLTVVRGRESERLVLPEPVGGDVSPVAVPDAARDDIVVQSGLAERLPRLRGHVEGPHPGRREQIPAAVQVVVHEGREHVGAGQDQAAAGVAALLAALRSSARAVPSRHVPVTAFAGVGSTDALADAIGRVVVQRAPVPAGRPTAVSRLGRRWVEALGMLGSDPPDIRVGRSPDCPPVSVAWVRCGVRCRWGYGADESSAVEHALVGMVTSIVEGGDEPTPSTHDAGTGPALWRAMTGSPGAPGPESAAALLAAAERWLPGFWCRLVALPPALTEIHLMAGVAGVET